MDVEGKRRGRRRRRDVIWSYASCFSTDLFSSIGSLVCQGYELLCERKKRALAVFFVMLEIISLVLDVFGQSRRCILLAEILLSVFGFVMTILTCMLERTRVHAEKQLGVVEICFSVVQLIATFLPVLGFKINNNYEAPVLLLVFAIINAVFTFTMKPPMTTAVLKMAHFCDGCTEKIRKTLLKTEGVLSETVDRQKGLVTVKGTMDAKALAKTLKKRLKTRPIEIVPPKTEKEEKESNVGISDEGGYGGKEDDAENGGGGGGGNGNLPGLGYGYPYPLNGYPVVQVHAHAPQMFTMKTRTLVQ
ncbi:hypothetical protein Patl1_22194 [Pistacia atlantica]|uniref:Uncharacterized protein n=1 Tax=Pistacia atlantica TaxID=434234 RepID=A0ACC1BH24_9ROSI|nr:hypothetical protein Patl1_22194 [Pistacia atlantica]